MIECDRLERQLEDESKVIDLVDNMQSTMTSVTSSTSASHTTSATKETPIAQQLALLDFGRLVTLNGSITSEQATRFYNQSKQADFTLSWKQVIMADSLDYIRLRVAKSYNQMKITKQEARLWNPDKLNLGSCRFVLKNWAQCLIIRDYWRRWACCRSGFHVCCHYFLKIFCW